jgi:hypothetical protein
VGVSRIGVDSFEGETWFVGITCFGLFENRTLKDEDDGLDVGVIVVGDVLADLAWLVAGTVFCWTLEDDEEEGIEEGMIVARGDALANLVGVVAGTVFCL